MVLPILGLLALGAGAAGRGQITSMFDRQDAARFERSGVNFSDPEHGLGSAGNIAQQFAAAGQLRSDPVREMIGQSFSQQQQDAANATRIRAAGISAAPAMMNAQLNREKYMDLKAETDSQNAALIGLGMPETYTQLPALRDQWKANYAANDPALSTAGMTPDEVARREQLRLLDERQRMAEVQQQELELQQLQNAPAAARLAQEQAYTAAVEPLLAENNQYQYAKDLLPDASRWAGDWFATPEGANARREVEQTMGELKQAWIQRKISFGREPSETVYKQADELFPSSAGMFNSREKLLRFINTQQRELSDQIGRERTRFVGNVQNNPTAVLDTYAPPPQEGRTSNTGAEVFADG